MGSVPLVCPVPLVGHGSSLELEIDTKERKGAKLLHRATMNADVWDGGGEVEVAG